jgi:hypothetical protein
MLGGVYEDIASMSDDSGRHKRLYYKARKLGSFVAAGQLDQRTAFDVLDAAREACRLKPAERQTISDGLTKGLSDPLDLSFLDDEPDSDWAAFQKEQAAAFAAGECFTTHVEPPKPDVDSFTTSSLAIPLLPDPPVQRHQCQYVKYIPAKDVNLPIDCREFRRCERTRRRLIRRLVSQMRSLGSLFVLIGDRPAGVSVDEYTRLVLADYRQFFILSRCVPGSLLMDKSLLNDFTFWNNLLCNMPSDRNTSGKLLEFWTFPKTDKEGISVDGYAILGAEENISQVKNLVDAQRTSLGECPAGQEQDWVNRIDRIALDATNQVDDEAYASGTLEPGKSLFRRRPETFLLQASKMSKRLESLDKFGVSKCANSHSATHTAEELAEFDAACSEYEPF